MGNKRITEKDFWMCTNGAVPAQLQGTNTSTKKQSGEKYITIQDKATSSWIDFGWALSHEIGIEIKKLYKRIKPLFKGVENISYSLSVCTNIRTDW